MTHAIQRLSVQEAVRADAQTNHYLTSLIGEREAGEYLGLSHRTLQRYRVCGGGPKFVRISARAVRYRRSDLKDWADGLTYSNTSQYGG